MPDFCWNWVNIGFLKSPVRKKINMKKKKSGEEEKTNLWLKNKQKAMSILDHQRSQI